ncbi:FAD-dependent oxidoreductase [Arthrobacter sp. ISL-72]|uniref:FAD-dependent oxidoreductase n=1 Tax=Arthrobacter sp. ISL-72 TaxID=2819114 RepID=UPI001BE722ED|nr:FAD-dependent oxidoreductase [Arthrobacter sp. ISL-72]MBT2595950.1 FAD-dependent oxidoreductase [Arthrobacter sp. ISL-72]
MDVSDRKGDNVATARIDPDTRILIIGAGVVGAALADDLTRQGMKSVTVVDQGPLYRTGGSSSHAPGFAFQTTGTAVMSELARRTLDKLDGLSWDGEWILKRVGGLELACDGERLEYLHRRQNLAQSWGVPSRIVSPEECGKLFPALDTSSVLGGLHTPSDGVVKAVRAVEWQARRAIENGARFYGHTQVTGFRIEAGRVSGVDVRATPPVPGNPCKGERLPEGTSFLEADVVVVCAGLWGPSLGRMLGLELPMVPMEHCSSSTSALPSLSGFSEREEIALPMVRHQATGSYFRQYGERLLWGSYEHRVIPVDQSEIASPEDFSSTRTEPAIHPLTWNDLKDGWTELKRLFPEANNCEPEDGYNGIFSFTPDGNPLLGEVPGIRGLWLGESVWLTQSAGVAGVLAEWIVTGDPGIDTTTLDFRRFDQAHLTRSASIARASENYDEVYDIHHPRWQTKQLRKFATTPFYLRQEALKAEFGTSQGGWERPLWYASDAKRLHAERDAWGTYGWSPAISIEARHALHVAGLVDRGATSIFEVRGDNAGRHLQEILSSPLSLQVDDSAPALVESPSGGIAAELTLVRAAQDSYLVIGSTPEDIWQLRRESRHSTTVTVSDLSSSTTALALIGPEAAAVLRSVTHGALPPTGSPLAPILDVGGVPVRAVAESLTGLGGWTLYSATEHGLYLWDLLLEAGARHGLGLVGDEAFTALRIANGVPAFGIEYGPQDNALEAGLVEARAGQGPRPGHRLLVRLRMSSDRHAIISGEPVSLDGSVVGYLTSTCC